MLAAHTDELLEAPKLPRRALVPAELGPFPKLNPEFVVRADPQVIMVGEIRDKETAEMAFRAAMTGHQVFTTLNDKTTWLWELPVATSQVPHWLPELAEAVGGQRLNRRLISEPVPLPNSFKSLSPKASTLYFLGESL